ncbi:MAG TPA: hypothetical protein VFM54_24080 [Micromonosporaceae bacterium]|nr:hypothetical protein [Micromonosporaceae bacterium]
MRSVPHSYWHEFRGAFARLPVWLPGTPLRLGDIGLLSADGWAPVSTLAKEGIGYRVGPQGASVDYDYRSVDGTEVSTVVSAQGDPLPAPVVTAGATLHYRFSRQGAFVVRARDVRARQIVDLAAVTEQVLAAYQAGGWSRDWTVVTEVGVAGPVFILVSGRAGAEATVELAATAAAGPVTALGVSTAVRVLSERGLAASFVSRQPATLMWSGRYVRDPRIGRTRFQTRGPDTGTAPGGLLFAEVTAAPRRTDADPAETDVDTVKPTPESPQRGG